jgi:hypothetical protein
MHLAALRKRCACRAGGARAKKYLDIKLSMN